MVKKPARKFTPLGSTYEPGGMMDAYGNKFSAAEQAFAEQLRKDEQALAHVAVTTIALVARKVRAEA